MKTARLVIGIIVVVTVIWVIAGEQMAGASADAVVNAPVVTVRAGTAGTLQMPDRALGSRVQSGEALAEVTDALVDRVRLNDLVMELDLARADTARIAADLEATRQQRDELLVRSKLFHEGRLADIRARLDYARNRLALLETGKLPEGDERRLLDSIDQTPDRLPGEPLSDALLIEHARERVAVLEVALHSAEQGVFLGDGYNDSPNAEQRAVELAGAISGFESQLAGNRAREAAIEARLGQERVRVNGLTGGDIAAPVNGLFWEVLEANGVTVQRGDPILRLVDCDATVVTLSVTERVYNTLRLGEPAKFRLTDRSEVFDATVARLAGSGAATVYDHMAVAPSQKHLERFDVTLTVPALHTDPHAGCMIGRTGRAFFDRRPLDWIRG